MQKGFAPIIILVGILILASIGGTYYFYKIKTPEQKACTMDAKICPDGSSVGRSGPNCEFAPCPSPTTEVEKISWDVPVGSIPQTEEQKLRQAVTSLAPQSIGKHPEWAYVSITKVTISGDWGLLNVEDKPKNPSLQATGLYEFLAQKTQSGWRVITPNDSDFCQTLKLAPNTLIDKSYYIGCEN